MKYVFYYIVLISVALLLLQGCAEPRGAEPQDSPALQAHTHTQRVALFERSDRGVFLPTRITIVLYDEETIATEGILEWLTTAAEVSRKWYPIIDKYLESEGHIPSGEFTIRAQSTGPIGWASGTTMGYNISWIAPGQRGEADWGMVAHEVVHFIQGYRRGPGTGVPFWIMEGIADFVRHALFEPEVPMRPVNPDNPERPVSYTQAYQISAGFLMWIADRYDLDIVPRLNVHGRHRTYSDEVFVTYTGYTHTELWARYVETVLRPLHAADRRMVPAEMFPNLMRHLQEFKAYVATLPVEPRPEPDTE